jgi:hypothetical protein
VEIEVSHYQGDVNRAQVEREGFTFGVAKASEDPYSNDLRR